MKKPTIAASLILAGAIGYGVAAHAQPAAAGKADPVKVDPTHYKVEFENDKVRVLHIRYGAGEKSVMHFHPESTIVYLTDNKTRMTMPDGKSQDMAGKAGTTAWAPAGSHLPQNIGDKAFEAILVEMKK